MTENPIESSVHITSENSDELDHLNESVQVWQLSSEDEKWIEHFYKECGREVTLAYTTLNQMKNWAMVIVGAFISAVVSLSKADTAGRQNGETITTIPVLIVAVIAYVFSLRFYIRAILCYINLIRWNTLQSSIISYKFVEKPSNGTQSLDIEALKNKLLENIVQYYHNWLSPVDRITQLISNLKLGFALVLILPLFFIIICAFQLWSSNLVKGFIVFSIGSTFVEIFDFFRSPFFDTPIAREKRTEKKKKSEVAIKKEERSFPIPVSRIEYPLLWLVNLIASSLVVLWPHLKVLVARIFETTGN